MLSLISAGAMLIGALFATVSPRGTGQHRRAMIVFALAAAIFLYHYLSTHPLEWADFEAEIALALVAFLLVFIRSLGRRR